jgi:type IV secretion system protein VirD4
MTGKPDWPKVLLAAKTYGSVFYDKLSPSPLSPNTTIDWSNYSKRGYWFLSFPGQLKSRETGYGADESITSNCHIQTAFPPQSARYCRTSLKADRSNDDYQKSRLPGPGRGLGSEFSTTMHEVQALCSHRTNVEPLYFQDPTFAALAAVPPPSISIDSDSLQSVPLSEVQIV